MFKPQDSREPAGDSGQRSADQPHRERHLGKLEELGHEEDVVDGPRRLAGHRVELPLGAERHVDDVARRAVALGVAGVRLPEGPKAEAEPDVDVLVDAQEAQNLARKDLREFVRTLARERGPRANSWESRNVESRDITWSKVKRDVVSV